MASIVLPGCGGGIDLDPPPEDNLNEAPVANAGTDQSVETSSAVQLDGSGSFDPDNDDLSYEWVQIAGTATALSGADTASPSFTAPADEDTLVFELTVDDGQASDSDFVTIQCTSDEEQEDNTPPVADAGTDQLATGGSTVQLDGSGSFDADGDSLSYSWSQTSGTSVTLIGAQTASPTFTAPNEDTTMTFELSVSDGNGGSDSDSVEVEIEAKTAILYVASFDGNNVVSFSDPATANGNIAPDTNLQGFQTLLDQPSDIVVTGSDDLLVTNFNTPSVTSYFDAPNTNGNLTPDGNVFGAATLLNGPVSLAINTSLDLLFVADINENKIYVYQGASTSSFNGNLPPVRVIETATSADLNAPIGINFGANDELYVANAGDDNVLVFANASNLNGDVTPSRIIDSALFNNLFDVYIDSDDNMFVVQQDGFIHTFNNAATLNGLQTPDFTLDVVPAAVLTAIAVDSSGTGYIVDALNHAIYSYDNIATLNGALIPDRTIQGANTQMVTPIRVFLDE